ncbi:MAG: ABC transporter substrate-binding protein [Methylacidiphilales bacterium]|nr:ABC transporter substrate-binding protein [Candidatus Methylacidiphilales bacterium]
MRPLFVALALLCVTFSYALEVEEHQTVLTVKQVVNQTIELLKNETDIEKRRQIIKQKVYPIIVPMIDFDQFSKLVLSRNIKTINSDQFKEFTGLLKQLLLQVYGNAFLKFSNQIIQFQPYLTTNQENRSTVTIKIIQPTGSSSTTVDFLFLKKESGWLVYDMKVEQLSLVASYRDVVNDEIQRSGINGILLNFRKKIENDKSK